MSLFFFPILFCQLFLCRNAILFSNQLFITFVFQSLQSVKHSKYALQLEEQTKVNYEYFVAGAVVLLVLCVFFGIGAGFITNCVGFFYPMYCTLAALEGTAEEKFKWLVYWPMYVTISLLEDYLTFVVEWIPFYYPAKGALLVYMMAPSLNGAKTVYTAMKPHISNLCDKVDAALKESSAKSSVKSD